VSRPKLQKRLCGWFVVKRPVDGGLLLRATLRSVFILAASEMPLDHLLSLAAFREHSTGFWTEEFSLLFSLLKSPRKPRHYVPSPSRAQCL
jgi:hypothetical protein